MKSNIVEAGQLPTGSLVLSTIQPNSKGCLAKVASLGVVQEMMGRPLATLLKGASISEVNGCLASKKSVLEVLDNNRLANFCAQVSHIEPWAMVVVLAADRHANNFIRSFRDIFVLCPRDLPCGE